MSEYCNSCDVSNEGHFLECACDSNQPDKFSQLDLGKSSICLCASLDFMDCLLTYW